MHNVFPHLLQTPAWGRAKCTAHPSWSWYLFVKPKQAGKFEQTQSLPNPSAIESSVLILERSLGLGQRLHYIPRGPYVDWRDRSAVEAVLGFIKDFARKKSVLMLRMEPDISEDEFDSAPVLAAGFRRVKDHIQPADTVRVPIQKSDDELMGGFHKKHRYNIKLAAKRGLTVRTSVSPKDVTLFYNLLKKTEERHGGVLHIHHEDYYQVVTRELAKHNMAVLYIVEKQGRPASASLVLRYGDQAIYMFGAADYEFRRDMPNHLREWESMRDARDEGLQYFDLWGATMRNDPGGGIMRYKLGYHDSIETLAGSFDWSPKPLRYKLFRLLDKLRRKL